MKKPKRTSSEGHKNIEAISRFYELILFHFGRALGWAILFFALMTLIESQTGTLGKVAGLAWLERFGRLPGVVSGQGNLGASSILSAFEELLGRGRVSLVLLGDSIFSPNFGGGAVSEFPLQQQAFSQAPGVLNIAQEGAEWAATAILINQIVAKHPATLPPLFLDFNPKFFSMRGSFTPAFPVEADGCGSRIDQEPEMESICQSLSDSWPKIYRILSHSFPSLLRGLQGQFDWVKTFVLRAPIYQSDLGRSNQRGLGIQHFRSFKSGLADFQAIQDDLVEHPRKTIYYYYNDGNTGSVDRFTDLVISEAAQADHPKQAWMRSLARAVSHWPAPVTVMYVTPSPRIRAVLSPERLRGLEAIQEMVRSVFVSQGKSDLHWVTNWQIAHQENDYVDQDHFSEQGNALLGDYLRKIREQR